MADNTSPSKFNVLTKRQITHDEAKESLRRLINSHFGNEPKARVGIPARPDYDDDLIMSAYVEQQSALTAAPSPAQEVKPVAWNDGAPPKPYSEEWFIAVTTYGDKVVLRALPEDYTYDFKTADETYIKKDKISKWMQFPDSGYISFAHPAQEAVTRVRKELQEAIAHIRNAGIDRAWMSFVEVRIKAALAALEPRP